MIVIAITGGIGAGKSLASEYFRSRGAVVLDTDEVAHEQLEPGTESFARVVDEFGPSVLDRRGEIDRAALAALAFVSDSRASALNTIVHPAVEREVEARLRAIRNRQDAPRAVVVEIPLLVEAPAFARVADVILTVAASPELRLKRTVAAGRDALDASRRLERQATEEQRACVADRVIPNEGTREEFVSQLARFWDEVVGSCGSE